MKAGDVYTYAGTTQPVIIVSYDENNILLNNLLDEFKFSCSTRLFDDYYKFNQKLTDLQLIKDIIE